MARWKQKATGAARHGAHKVMISRGYRLLERIAMSVDNALDRVIASRANKRLSLVT
jgi:hypothetical protein